MDQCQDSEILNYLKGLKANLKSLSDLCGIGDTSNEPRLWSVSEMLDEIEIQSAGFFKYSMVNLQTNFRLENLEFLENREEIQRSILNLLKNAAENSYKFGSVRFEAYVRDENLVFEVENLNGPLFDINSIKQRKEKGITRGLGLSIVQKSLEKVGGQFFPITSDNGMMMRIEIPIHVVRPGNLLLVDDDKYFSEAASCWLESIGFSVDSISHEDEIVNSEEYDFFIVDIDFGKGFAKVRECRLPRQKVIFISGSKEMIEEADRNGYKVALKGCTLDNLVQQISKVA